MFNKKLLATAIAATIGSVSATANADTVLTFINNTTTGVFPAGSEFGVFTPAFSLNDGPKDVMSGGETWTFNTSGSLTGTAGTDAITTADPATNDNVGAAAQAPITAGVTGYPQCATANSCDIMQNGVDFLSAGDFTMTAPTTSNSLGSIFGDSVFTQLTGDLTTGTFSVFFPVVYTQWAGGNYAIGTDYDTVNNYAPDNPIIPGDQSLPSTVLDPNQAPGVTLNGTITGGNFNLTGSYTMTRDEVTVGGFAGQTVFWDLNGTIGTTVIPVPAAVWLFGSGLIGLVGIARRKKAA